MQCRIRTSSNAGSWYYSKRISFSCPLIIVERKFIFLQSICMSLKLSSEFHYLCQTMWMFTESCKNSKEKLTVLRGSFLDILEYILERHWTVIRTSILFSVNRKGATTTSSNAHTFHDNFFLSERRRVGGWDADAEESTDTQFTFCKSSLVIVNNGHSLELVRKSNIFFTFWAHFFCSSLNTFPFHQLREEPCKKGQTCKKYLSDRAKFTFSYLLVLSRLLYIPMWENIW